MKKVASFIYEKIASALRSECERQTRKLQHEIEITEARFGPDDPAVLAAKAFLGDRANAA